MPADEAAFVIAMSWSQSPVKDIVAWSGLTETRFSCGSRESAFFRHSQGLTSWGMYFSVTGRPASSGSRTGLSFLLLPLDPPFSPPAGIGGGALLPPPEEDPP